MNWDAIAAIGQLLGSVAIFVTLGYLAVQVKHARGELRRSIRQGRGEAQRELYLFRAGDRRMNELAQRANEALGATPGAFVQEMMEQTGLTREEITALNSEQIAWWSYRVQVVAYVDELPPEDRVEFDASTRAFYSVPYSRRWLEASKPRLNPSAVRYIENLLAQPR
jgi:hypothetical protein